MLPNVLTQRFAGVAAEVSQIRRSLTLQSPLARGFENDAREAGYRALRNPAEVANERFKSAVVTLMKTIHGVNEGRVPEYILKEAMSVSDFPIIFGDVLYRQMLGNYTAWQNTYQDWCRIYPNVADFRRFHLLTMEGGDGTLGPAIPEYGPYPETNFREGQYFLQVAKYGRRYGVSWEMGIVDSLGAFNERPQAMATGARRSEEYLATQLLVDINGPHATFFSVGNDNIITGNPALSFEGLKTAWAMLATKKDADGNPIRISAVRLVICAEDEVLAQDMLNTTMVRSSDAPFSTTELGYTNNWMKARINLSVNPYIKIIASNAAHNPWFLIADPADVTQRPAFAFGFLRGYRRPQMWLKDPDAIPIGGGSVDIRQGSFDNDSIDYKLRHVFGAAQIDPKMAVASAGS